MMVRIATSASVARFTAVRGSVPAARRAVTAGVSSCGVDRAGIVAQCNGDAFSWAERVRQR